MLGWFKKKFGKKTEEPAAVVPELDEALVAAASPPPVELAVEPMDESPPVDQKAVVPAEPGEAEMLAPASEAQAAEPAPEAPETAAVAVAPEFFEPLVEPAAAVSPVAGPDEGPAAEWVVALPESVVEPVVEPVAELAAEPAAEPGDESSLVAQVAPVPAESDDAAPAPAPAAPPAPVAEPEAEPPAEPLVEEETVVPGVVPAVAPEVREPEPEPEAQFEAEPAAEPQAPSALAPQPVEPSSPVEQESTEAIEAELTEPAGEIEPVTEPPAETTTEPAVEPSPEPSPEPLTAASILAPNREKPAAKSMFRRLQERLGKTKESLVYRLDRLFLGKKEIDQDLFDQLEEILITADLGVGTTMALLDEARKKVKRDLLSDPQALKKVLRDQILAYIEESDQPAELVMPAEGPFVIMVVGVNGVGKTTTIGKMAAKFKRAGQSVLLVAGDTFRAAAINQLRIWGDRVGVEVIAQQPGADPSSVVFDGLIHGVAHDYDVIIIDTAGRLHTSVNLMEELKKIKRVIGKKMAGAPHEVMLVLDANTGQNGVSQAKLFHEAVGVTGLTLTKLDGTAKGGIVANVCREVRIPVRFIGIGEQIDDLRDFDAGEFVDALFDRQRE